MALVVVEIRIYLFAWIFFTRFKSSGVHTGIFDLMYISRSFHFELVKVFDKKETIQKMPATLMEHMMTHYRMPIKSHVDRLSAHQGM